jgi:hypothetical protein
MKIPVLFLAVSLLMGGCTTLPDLTRQLEATEPCCSDFTQMKFLPLPAVDEASFVFDKTSPVFIFDVGKSYFIGYSLPAKSEGKVLQVMALATGSTAFESATLAQIYCPRMLFLGEDKRSLEANESRGEFIRNMGFSGLRFGATSSATIPKGSAYVVLHSNPATFGEFRRMYTRGSIYMAGNIPVISPGGEAIPFPCAPIADVKLRIR